MALLLAEIAAYALVIDIWGWSAAFAVGLGSLALGFLLLARLGQNLGTLFSGPVQGPVLLSFSGLFSGGLMVAGALLLILPGFLTDFLGLGLVVASWALKLVPRRFVPQAAPAPGPTGPVTDLNPEEWTSSRHSPP